MAAMCSVAPRAAAPGFGATGFLERRRGVAAAALAPASSSEDIKTGEPIRCARAAEVSTASAQKRGRHHDVVVVVDPAMSSALRVRMEKELIALQGLVKRAKLLPRSAAPAEKKYAAPVLSSPPSAEKTRAPPPAKPATEAAHVPAAKQQLPAAAKNPAALEVPNKQQKPAEAPAAAKHQHQHQQQRPDQRGTAKTEAPKKRRLTPEELARAAAREEFRRMLVEMEKAALPDETIYPEDLQELGIAFEHVVTRTRKEAWLEDHGNKVVFVGA